MVKSKGSTGAGRLGGVRMGILKGSLSAWVTVCLGLGIMLRKLARKVLDSFVYRDAKRGF